MVSRLQPAAHPAATRVHRFLNCSGIRCYFRVRWLLRPGYFSFFALPNFLAKSPHSAYNFIYGAKGFVSPVPARLVRAAIMLFENSTSRAEHPVTKLR